MPTHLRVTFNNLTGAAQQPISHTCNKTIELSTGYLTYLEFAEELKVYMSSINREYSCSMDAV